MPGAEKFRVAFCFIRVDAVGPQWSATVLSAAQFVAVELFCLGSQWQRKRCGRAVSATLCFAPTTAVATAAVTRIGQRTRVTDRQPRCN